ncbi:hypothetical protein RJ639_046842 [Escallonia herrerae]|uniref:Reverse transcriptase/retrotransposon-derived protein RNase H-like domain-containing protein n=1 Tax=Escallonia herrerae TaxID=1293975 RepID=A0AA88WCJ3_9ASTE|nr:hypothetical protein RJ639_046842 [Escallonia herrerae]
MYKKAITGRAVVTPSPSVEAPKPKEFGGKWDAKELDNFIWHMERYFEGASILDEKAKRRKHNDIEKGLCTIDTWDVYKKEIKRQFYPENVTYEARKKLRELKHKSSISDYGYSAKAAPLMDLLKKGKTWEWSKRCQTAFKGLKETMTKEPVLALLDHTKVFELQTDASDFAIGGVLMQEGHLIAFESRKLNDTERRYTVQEKEITAVVHCLCTWRHYLLGSRFLIKTDNIATSYFQSQRKLSPKQARWQDFLAEFDYVMSLTPLALEGDYKEKSPLTAQVARSWNEQADVARSYLDKVWRKMKK